MTIEETILNAFELDLRQAWDLAQILKPGALAEAARTLDAAKLKLEQLQQRALPSEGAEPQTLLPVIDV